MRTTPRLAMVAALLLPFAGCKTTEKTPEEQQEAEQYQKVTYTGSHFPKKVKTKDPAMKTKGAEYLEKMQSDLPQRGEGAPHPREAR